MPAGPAPGVGSGSVGAAEEASEAASTLATPATRGAKADLSASDEGFVDIRLETRVWGCPDCRGKDFVVVEGARHCAACMSKAMGDSEADTDAAKHGGSGGAGSGASA